ncbi:hypothetical protein DFS34DRAFT_661649 [Phlyctochytrium arcticum]|nr:hypothetical protein DFS34DRAFT_661649 [Phlyctochytrium arcticum]
MIHEIILNSSFSSSPTEPTWMFPNLDVQWFKIKEVIIPSSNIYTVNDTNNKLVFYEDNGSKRTASIPRGYYNSVNIVPALKTAMENVGDQEYDVTFGNVTKKLTINSTAPFKKCGQFVRNPILLYSSKPKFHGGQSGWNARGVRALDPEPTAALEPPPQR